MLASKMYKANQDFIEFLKSEGYTFIDLGSDGATDLSVFYSMEIDKIFN
jgi:ribose 5-phosphate isomerase RpiB